MAKNIVILCDGTSNQIEHDRSNILRLYGCLKKDKDQIVYYDPGVGTLGAGHSWYSLRSRFARVSGLATGAGLDENVLQAYRFLVEHYDHGKKDRQGDRQSDTIILYGFSRGAYTVRVLAGFIHAFGLIKPHQLNLLDYAYGAYKRIGENKASDGGKHSAFGEIRLHERALDPVHPTIKFLGIFDTVSSVVEKGKYFPTLRSHAFTSVNPSVAAVRHAMALDERRRMFLPSLWPSDQRYRSEFWNSDSETDQDAEEVWFPGSHGDVGGGYPEDRSGLAKIPLHWMIEESKKFGISFKTRTVNRIVLGKKDGSNAKTYTAPDPDAEMNESMRIFWWLFEFLPRIKRENTHTNRMVFAGRFFWPWFEKRVLPPDAQLHDSSSYRTGDSDDEKSEQG